MKIKTKNGISLMALLFLCCSCSHQVYDAIDWQDKAVIADGRIPEWTNPLRFYDYKSKINYSISNDRKNLYVCMKISNETVIAKIFRGGIEFRIDTLGKKSFPVTFFFPLANQEIPLQQNPDQGQPKRNYGEKSQRFMMVRRHLNEAKDYRLKGFKCPSDASPAEARAATNINAAIHFDSLGIMYYEAAIPFKSFYKDELFAADTHTVFNYEIKVNALTPPSNTDNNNNNSGNNGGNRSMGGNGMGGMSGGGMSGGGMRGGGGQRYAGSNSTDNNELYITNLIKMKMRFSFK